MSRKRLVAIAVSFLALACAKPVAHLTPLAPAPDWSLLEPYQNTISKDEFVRLLNNVYAPDGAAGDLITIEDERALIRKMSQGPKDAFELRFATEYVAPTAVPRYWRARDQIRTTPEKPLDGIRIALDPGHLGGEWAEMEYRWYQVDRAVPVAEGDMNLKVAQLLKERLEAQGAQVFLVRDSANPTTPKRPADFAALAEQDLRDKMSNEDPEHPQSPSAADVQSESERLFYRVSEIRERGRIVNQQIRPDLTICIHFNADAWGDPKKPGFSSDNHLHLLVNGAYSADEVAFDDIRLEMLLKLLNRSDAEELAVSESVAAAMAKGTRLPPCALPGVAVKKIGTSPYLWARNLLANRLYQSPTIYLEPYVMNHPEVFARVQMGDYNGERRVGTQMRKSLYREYADSVTQGLVDYYRP